MIYLHNRTPVFETPSDASKKYVQNKLNKSLAFDDKDKTKLDVLRKLEGLSEPVKNDPKFKKKFKVKQPNPLSCKKKKKRSIMKIDNNNFGINKKDRKDLKMSAKIKKSLKG